MFERCKKLKEIHIVLRDVPILEVIEVYYSSCSTVDFAKRIQDQMEIGNDRLKVISNLSYEDEAMGIFTNYRLLHQKAFEECSVS